MLRPASIPRSPFLERAIADCLESPISYFRGLRCFGFKFAFLLPSASASDQPQGEKFEE
jgi:hypothetical protein